MASNDIDVQKVLGVLDRILELELAGVVRYTHYSFMVYGHSRIPIVKWMNEQADEGMLHARAAGEWITQLGGHPSLRIGKLLETHQHDIEQLLRESLEHEREGIAAYYELLELVRDKHVPLEEYARQQIHGEEMHVGEVEKMLRRPGSVGRADGGAKG